MPSVAPISMYHAHFAATVFDYNGPNDYSTTFSLSLTAFDNTTAFPGQQWQQNKTDLGLRSAYKYMGIAPETPQERLASTIRLIIRTGRLCYRTSVVQARLGSKAAAWARLLRAHGPRNPRPSREPGQAL
ncbi:hypothetical protein EDC04DRAFT_2029669 [Pisolithus marmoratus]|nr:hypothetical protein EDC04DRAFT_2029669 [Pisolithus marmoratus]